MADDRSNPAGAARMIATDLPRKGPPEPSGFGVRVPGGVQTARWEPVHTGPASTSGTLYGRLSVQHFTNLNAAAKHAVSPVRVILADVPGWAWFALAAPLITLTHIWAGVLGQLLVHWIYTDWSRPNAAFYAGCGWLVVSLVTWGVSILRVAEWTGVAQRVTPSGQGIYNACMGACGGPANGCTCRRHG